MTKAGYILGIVGSSIMLGTNLVMFLITAAIGILSGMFDSSPGATADPLDFIPITQITTVILALFALIYAMKAKGGAKIGYMVILIIGLITAIGVFIPLVPPRILDMGDGSTYPAPAITLVTSLIYIDPFLLLNGGLIGLLTAEFVSTEEREELKLEKEVIKKERIEIRKERDRVRHEKKAAKKRKKDKGIVEVEEEKIEELEIIKREREALKREREALEREREELEEEKETDTED